MKKNITILFSWLTDLLTTKENFIRLLLCMSNIIFKMFSWGISSQTWIKASVNSWTVCGATWRWRMEQDMMSQMCSIGFRSGEGAGHPWAPPAEPLLYGGCLCLSFPPGVCSICTTAGETDSPSVLLPNRTGWFHRSGIDLELHCAV